MDIGLVQLLERTGFTEKESRVYLALLELGQGDVSDIAKAAELKRSIIYVLLEGLIKRGFVSELPGKKIKIYQAIDPSVILNKLKITARDFGDLLPILRTLHNKGEKRPKISYYETLDGIWNIYDEMTQTDEAFFISSYEAIEKHFPGSIERWIRHWKKGLVPVRGKHLVPNNGFDLETIKKFQEIEQKVRYLPKIKNFDMDFSVYKNKLAITSFGEKPFIVVIESAELAKSALLLFELIWGTAKEIKG